jgi:hypothetical protein
MKAEAPSISEIAADFTALWLAGEFSAAGERYWAGDVVSIEPGALPDGTGSVTSGIEALRTKNAKWFAVHGIEDLSIDGPFVTGDSFALFMDMMIAHAGARTPHSQIAVYALRDGKIVEERYFYA